LRLTPWPRRGRCAEAQFCRAPQAPILIQVNAEAGWARFVAARSDIQVDGHSKDPPGSRWPPTELDVREAQELDMFKSSVLVAAITFALAAPIGFADTALAAKKSTKKLTYEEAFKKCTPFAQQVPEWNVSGRTSRGAACMRRYGHQI
jgi:hypothetical protein